MIRPSMNIIETDITYRCNITAKCENCNRQCRQAPSSEQISLQDYKKFIAESIEINYPWRIIRLVGGEPTLHSEFMEFVFLLKDYQDKHNPNAIITIHTNYYSQKTKDIVAELRGLQERWYPGIHDESLRKIQVYASDKSSDSFTSFYQTINDAPIDHGEQYKPENHSYQGCYAPRDCGIAMSPFEGSYGFYCCAHAGAFHRIFPEVKPVCTSLKDLTEEKLIAQYQTACPLCGIYLCQGVNKSQKSVQSKTWTEGILRYNKDRKPLE